MVLTLPDGSETSSDDPEVDERLSAMLGRPVHLTTVAPDGNSYLAVWPDIDGVLPDEFRAENAVEGDENDGTLTDLGLALASPPGTFFDVSALHLVTTATLTGLGELEPESRFAVERYRPNIVVDTAGAPFSENEWAGRSMHLGPELTALGIIPTMRCIMTTLAQGDPATRQRDPPHRRPQQPDRDPRSGDVVVRRCVRRGHRTRPRAGW